MDDTLPIYKGWTAEATLYVSIDVLQFHTGARHSALEGTQQPLPRASW
jgi:hypothetical protein